ncbi:hypothetical protein MFIFM68171_04048 [Madurella fahalii]|uniref:Meiotically up-regulated 65 protein n=1 Tax=Madurella fahalii TaxID=1157608 RepID=A0ABQ0G7U8_9PEZI
MPKIKHHRSSRRVPPPKDSDFDHEIKLVDHSDDESGHRPSSAGPSSSRRDTSIPSTSAAPQLGDGETGADTHDTRVEAPEEPFIQVEQPTPQVGTDRPRSGAQTTKDRGRPRSPESAIDILYENQRGGFLCGIPLFSSKALGNLDPPAWTNYAHRPSPTNIHTAQVPDPSWEWAWPEWRINHGEGVDEDGWEYSFAFSRKFSWHKARWWNSFVRRRAWIRKRVKKISDYLGQDPHMLNTEYFSIRPSSELSRDRSPSRTASLRGSRRSMSTANAEGGEQARIEHADDLLDVLRGSRIDREKIEAVDNYLENAQDDLAGLQDIMHEIMSLFVFQTSRRVLLTRMTEVYDETAARRKKGDDVTPELERRMKNLGEAVKHADEEVRRLEYWSDVKGVAEEGGSKGAVDQKKGWDSSWQGLDKSGPSAPTPKHTGKKEDSRPGEAP